MNYSRNSTDLKSQLNNKGYRLTEQRRVVLEVIQNNRGSHLSSEEIYELVRKSRPGIGLATVYRTLPLLEKMNLLSKIYLDDGCTRYEFCNPDEDQHHHLICIGCGSVYEIQEDLLGTLEKQIMDKTFFKIKNHKVKFYGYCSKCLQQDTQDNTGLTEI